MKPTVCKKPQFEPDADALGATEPGQQDFISVVIPHYEDLANLERCLSLLEAQSLPRNSYEIIVCDNASPCGLEAVKAVAGNRAQVVLNPVKGAGITRNVGVQASRGNVLAFIDSDCRPDRDFLRQGAAMLAHYDIVGGSIRVDLARDNQPTPSEAFELVFAFRNDRYIKEKHFSVTAALFAPRRVFDAVGQFRAGVSEDLEWGNRATAMGYTLGFAGDAIVGHPARRNWSELARKWRRLTEEGFLLAVEQPAGRLRWFVRSWIVLASTLPHLLKIVVSPRLSRVSDRFAAIGILIRLRLMRFFWSQKLLLQQREKQPLPAPVER